MLEIKVGKENSDYSTISEAIQAVPYSQSAVLRIAEGVYHEKLFCDKKDITFIGAGRDKTIIEFGDGAYEVMDDGSKRGTFRSYTALFAGERVEVKDLTIKNSAGDGRVAGQALAVYADSKLCLFENVNLEGHQDTLFMSPLPLAERQKNGFMGPRMLTDRIATAQVYRNCNITGDVDFIFGGADAVFEDCVITCNRRDGLEGNDRIIHGYITAPSESPSNIGMIFRRCRVSGEEGCEEGSVFLGRPWRDTARAVFIDCIMDDTIAPERFSGWGDVQKPHPDSFFGEYGTIYPDGRRCDLSHKNDWVKKIDEKTCDRINGLADDIIGKVVRK